MKECELVMDVGIGRGTASGPCEPCDIDRDEHGRYHWGHRGSGLDLAESLSAILHGVDLDTGEDVCRPQVQNREDKWGDGVSRRG